MIDADARELVTLIAWLLTRKKQIENDTAKQLKAGSEPKEVRVAIAAKYGEGLLAWVSHAETVCRKYDIDISDEIKDVYDSVEQPERWTTTLSECLNRMKHGIYKELKRRKFMYMPNAEAAYYDHQELFGPVVSKRFPKANKEIIAAGNCYATGSYTACVFHLMRAVEIAGKVMVSKRYLNVAHHLPCPLELCEWGQLKQAMDKGLDALRAGSRTDLKKKQQLEYYSHAVGVFANFKDAWRNKVNHGRHTYKAGETKDAMDNTRQFMNHIAEKMKEPKRL